MRREGARECGHHGARRRRRVLRLNGYKFYSTGTLFADVIAVSAVDAEGSDLQAIVPTDRAGVELFDDWDGFGQRTTASGGTRFTDVEVRPVEVTTVSDGSTSATAPAFLQLYLAAVAAGIARPSATTPSTTCGTRPDRRRIRWPTPLPAIRSCCTRSARSPPPPPRPRRSC